MGRILLAFFLSFVFLGVGQQAWALGARSQFSQKIDKLRAPLWKLKVSWEQEGRFWQNLRGLHQENTALSEEVLFLEKQLLRKGEELHKCSLWQNQLDWGTVDSADLVPARVIGRQGNFYLWLDRGFKAGLAPGNLIVYLDNFVGWVAEVEAQRSLVKLVSGPDVLLTAIDRDSPTRAKGLVRGNFGLSLVMDNILPEAEIKEGDLIISYFRFDDGSYEEVPLILGEVEGVETEVGRSVKRATLKSRLDFLSLEEVFIIRGGNEDNSE